MTIATPRSDLSSPLCAALAHEIRDVRALVETLSTVFLTDHALALRFVAELQAIDLIVQRADESARLLDRIAAGDCQDRAVDAVRLEDMQARLRVRLKGV